MGWSKPVALTCAIILIFVTLPGTAPAQHDSKLESGAKVRVPNLHGRKLPLAEALIRMAGLRVGKEDCDCTFGVVIKSNWYVCMQRPAAKQLVARGTRVWTYSERDPSDC